MDSQVVAGINESRIMAALKDFKLRPMGTLVTITELERWMDADKGSLDESLRDMESRGLILCAPGSGAVRVVSPVS
jgi:hypothetical protein